MKNLPAIANGTEKQIAYAEAIRAALIKSAWEHKFIKTPEKLDGFTATVAEHFTTDAVTWIETFKATTNGIIDNGTFGGLMEFANAMAAASCK